MNPSRRDHQAGTRPIIPSRSPSLAAGSRIVHVRSAASRGAEEEDITMAAQAPTKPWELTLEHMIACNCDWGCPCIYESRPTPGYCEGVVAWRVREGSMDGVDLSGATWVTALKWPGAIHEGSGQAVVFLDEAMTEEQRPLVEALATGQAGGPLAIFMGTCDAGIQTRPGKVTWNFAGKDGSFHVAGAVALDLEAIRNPVTGDEHYVSVELPTGLLNQREDFHSSRELRVATEGIAFEYSGRHAATSLARWTGP
jgi:hypothetical protein